MWLLRIVRSGKNQTQDINRDDVIEKKEVEEQFRQIVKKQLKLPVKLYSL